MFSPHARLALAAAVLDAALLIGMTAFPFHLYHTFEGTAQTSGVIGGIQAVIYAILSLIAGRFLGKLNAPLRWGMAGIFLCGIFFLTSYYQQNFLAFSFFYCISIGMLSIAWPSMHSWLGAEPDPDARGKHMAVFNTSWSVGLAVGALLGGFIYSAHPALPFWTYFLLCLLSAGLIYTLPDEKTLYRQEGFVPNEEHEAYDLKGERLLMAAWISNGLGMALAGITRLVFTKHVDELVSGGELRLLFESTPPALLTDLTASEVYSVMAFILSVACAAVFFFMGRTRAWHHRLDFLVVIQILAAGAIFVLGNTRSAVVMSLAFMVIGIANGAGFFAAIYYCMSNVNKRHARATINEFAVGAGSAAGPIAAGMLTIRFGLYTTFVIVPILVAAVIVVQCLLVKKAHVTTEPDSSPLST